MAFTNRISMDALGDVNDSLQKFETKKCAAQEAYKQTNITSLLIRRYVDFIVESPYDVLCCIMNFLDGDIDTMLKCIEVSRAWKQILLQCPTAWRTICADRSFWTASVLTIQQQQLLSKISPFVEKIYVHGTEDALVRCIDFFRLYKFSSLQFLEIKYTLVRVIDLYDALSYVADTLTEFRIVLRRPFMVSITRILSICPHLKSLHCNLLLVIEYFRTTIPPLNVSLLEHFHLHVSRNKLLASNLEAILLHTPHLRSLFVSSHDEDLLPAIIRQCPKIEAINTGFLNPRDDDYYKHRDHIISRRYPYFSGIDCSSKRSSTRDKEGQLKILTLGPVKSIQPLREQLKMSYRSLQYLCLSPAKFNNDDSTTTTTLATSENKNTADNISDNSWQPLFTSVMPNLTYLLIIFKQCPLKFCEQLPSILGCCPNLKTLRFTGYMYEAPQSMLLSQVTFRTLEAISQLDKLVQLLIRDVHVDTESLSWLLKHCSRATSHNDDVYGRKEINYHSTLRVLYIKMPSGRLSTSLLTYIARIKSLEKLTVLLPNVGNVKSSDVAHFCKELMILPKLFSLTLGYIAINSEAAQCLATSKTVSSLRIEDVDISEAGIKMLRDNIMDVCIYYSDDDNV